ncbi:hypothetical protein M569_09558, partial [Genlisea aurea]
IAMKTSPFLFIFFFSLFRTLAGFNITHILEQYPDFDSFNNFLTQAKLASQINSRQTITVLAVDNGGVSSLSGMSSDAMKNVLSAHVVLDYYDEAKLHKLSNKSAILTTLFQSSGLGRGQQGFLNVTILSGGKVAFGSAVAGAPLGANLVKSVFSQPYNVSVLQVSSLIIPPGIDSATNATSPPSNRVPVPAPPPPVANPGPHPSAAASPEATSDSPQAAAEVPSPATGTNDSPASSPAADSPSVETPSASVPAGDSPSASVPAADTPASDTPSSGS